MLWALQSCSSHQDTRYWCFGFTGKAFLFIIFPIINVYSWNERNLSPFILLWALQSCSSYWDTRYLCFGFARKAFPLIIFLIINVHSRYEKTWKPIIISILFVMGITIMFFSLGYTILMLWICKKSFSFHYCNANNKKNEDYYRDPSLSHSMNEH